MVRCSIGGAAPPPYDVERDRTILEAVGVGLLCVAASAMFANGASASRVSNSAQLAAALYGGGGGAGAVDDGSSLTTLREARRGQSSSADDEEEETTNLMTRARGSRADVVYM